MQDGHKYRARSVGSPVDLIVGDGKAPLGHERDAPLRLGTGVDVDEVDKRRLTVDLVVANIAVPLNESLLMENSAGRRRLPWRRDRPVHYQDRKEGRGRHCSCPILLE